MKEEKNIVTNVILSIVTCGIFAIVWFIQLNDDAREYSKDQSMPTGGVAFLLSLVTCGIYGIYWAYKMGKAIQKAKIDCGMTNAPDNSVMYLVLEVVGLGIVDFCLMQNELNEITRAKNGVQA